MISTGKMLAVLTIFLSFLLVVPAMADTDGPGHGHHYGMKGAACRHQRLSPDWRETLSDGQKEKISRMHLALAREMSKLGAALELKRAELKELVTEDRPDEKAVNSKIKEMIGLKEKMLRTKYSHIIEMRSVLNAKQRVSFDTGLLKKGGFGHGMGHAVGGH